MSLRTTALTLLVGIISTLAAAQSPELKIGVDRRVELIAIIFRLAGHEEFKHSFLAPYSADIDTFFAPQRDHEAVTLARQFRERNGLGQSRAMAIAIRLMDPPALEARVPFDSAAGWPATPAEMQRFVKAVHQFAIDSHANQFFDNHRALYDSVNARIRNAETLSS